MDYSSYLDANGNFVMPDNSGSSQAALQSYLNDLGGIPIEVAKGQGLVVDNSGFDPQQKIANTMQFYTSSGGIRNYTANPGDQFKVVDNRSGKVVYSGTDPNQAGAIAQGITSDAGPRANYDVQVAPAGSSTFNTVASDTPDNPGVASMMLPILAGLATGPLGLGAALGAGGIGLGSLGAGLITGGASLVSALAGGQRLGQALPGALMSGFTAGVGDTLLGGMSPLGSPSDIAANIPMFSPGSLSTAMPGAENIPSAFGNVAADTASTVPLTSGALQSFMDPLTSIAANTPTFAQGALSTAMQGAENIPSALGSTALDGVTVLGNQAAGTLTPAANVSAFGDITTPLSELVVQAASPENIQTTPQTQITSSPSANVSASGDLTTPLSELVVQAASPQIQSGASSDFNTTGNNDALTIANVAALGTLPSDVSNISSATAGTQPPKAGSTGVLGTGLSASQLATLAKLGGGLAGLLGGLTQPGGVLSGAGGTATGAATPGGGASGTLASLAPVYSASLPAPSGLAANLSPLPTPNIDWNRYAFGPEQQFFSDTQVPVKAAAHGGSIQDFAVKNFATGGSSNFAVNGPGTGRSDSIPAKLSDGEYVMDAETVALLGDGSNKAGAAKLDQFRANIRKQKGANLAKGKFSVDAKVPEAYLSGGRV